MDIVATGGREGRGQVENCAFVARMRYTHVENASLLCVSITIALIR